MRFKTLLKLIELKTLVAGVLPVLLGSVYAWYAFDQMSVMYFVLLTLAMMLVQSATNMTNDYYDYINGADGIEKQDEKALVSDDVSPKQVLMLTFAFRILALFIGIFIGSRTSYAILLVAIAGDLVATLYATGPLPISHTPFGEIVSGITMGIGITTTTIYIHSGVVDASTVLVAVPTALFVGTILLSNNLSDIKEDIEAGRKTLPILIGVQRSEKLWLFNVMMILVLTIALTWMKLYPAVLLLFVALLYPYKAIRQFSTYAKNRKSKGRTMGLIGQIGVKYHIAVIAGLIVAMVV